MGPRGVEPGRVASRRDGAAPAVKEVDGDREDDGRDHERLHSASLSEHAGERRNDHHDASQDCDDPKVLA